VAEKERGRGWIGVAALALATTVLSVVQPVLLIFIPLALLFVALPPRRPLLVVLAVVIGWLSFADTAGQGPLWYFERGWSLVLGGWFVALVALMPRWRFLPRALAAVAGTAVTAGVILAAGGGGLGRLDTVVSAQFRSGASQALAAWARAVGFERVSEEMQRAVYAAAELQIKLYPALLALASVAALGIAWWAYDRLARGHARPLGRLREFRFRDELVWLLIAGLVLLALPIGELANRAGENLLMFMAALYALRGVAVLVMVGGVPGPLGWVLGALLVVFLYPLVMAATFLVGLSDTWLDIRARRSTGRER
jgi:hypothetical protein